MMISIYMYFVLAKAQSITSVLTFTPVAHCYYQQRIPAFLWATSSSEQTSLSPQCITILVGSALVSQIP